jgi:hypothetical protein
LVAGTSRARGLGGRRGRFSDGKGFAVDRDVHDWVGNIEIFYQLKVGRFISHLSDD